MQKKKVYADFGPFVVEMQKGWQFSQQDDGSRVLVYTNDKGIMEGSISFSKKHMAEMNERSLPIFEKSIMAVEHDKQGRFYMLGCNALILQKDFGPVTKFAIFPWDSSGVFSIFVSYQEKRKNMSDEMVKMLRAFRVK